MLEKAYGKINLSINVLRRRPDGYHDLDMIMVPIALHDDLQIEISEQMSYTGNTDLPFDQHNTICKAIELLRAEFGFRENFRINLTKRIPMQAGLAGGSADGAAALRAVNRLLDLGLSEQQLALRAAKIGMDVCFCIYQRAARVKGAGEIIEPFEMKRNYEVLLVKPQQGISTGKAYGMLDLERCDHPDITALQEALINGEEITALLGNSLEESAFRLLPEIREIKETVKSFGYNDVLMSGSGSTVFVLLPEDKQCEELINELKNRYNFVIKTQTGLI